MQLSIVGVLVGVTGPWLVYTALTRVVTVGLLKGGVVFLQGWQLCLVMFGCSEPAGTLGRLPEWLAVWPEGMYLL